MNYTYYDKNKELTDKRYKPADEKLDTTITIRMNSKMKRYLIKMFSNSTTDNYSLFIRNLIENDKDYKLFVELENKQHKMF